MSRLGLGGRQDAAGERWNRWGIPTSMSDLLALSEPHGPLLTAEEGEGQANPPKTTPQGLTLGPTARTSFFAAFLAPEVFFCWAACLQFSRISWSPKSKL